MLELSASEKILKFHSGVNRRQHAKRKLLEINGSARRTRRLCIAAHCKCIDSSGMASKRIPARRPEDALFEQAPPAARAVLQQHKASRRQQQRAEFAARVLGGDRVDQRERPEVSS